MTLLRIAEAELIDFVLVDPSGVEVSGLGTTFMVEISKNGGDLVASTGIKAEIGSGWYSYELTPDETDTEGPLAMKITGAGVVQQNLIHKVSGTIWIVGAGTYILTANEAAIVLRCAENDPNMLNLLPIVDTYLANATGYDWANDPYDIPMEAKSAARMLLVMWHENPAMIGMPGSSLGFGLAAVLMQLKALALEISEDDSA